MNVLITGSRSWENIEVMKAALEELPRDAQLIHGGAKGADVMASLIAEMLGFDKKPHIVRPEYSYWKEKLGPKIGGRVAPLKRNVLMLEGKITEEGPVDPSLIPDLVLAFFMTDEETGGTAACVSEARKRNMPVTKYRHP
jgi:hypothetical protein